VEFIGLLNSSMSINPQDAIIRVVLDNHSAHISKETVAYLGTRPGASSTCTRQSMAPGST